MADTLPPQSARTASWYAARPGVMHQVLDACRDDPGHARRVPDCTNANQAELLLTEREARANAGLLVSPASPKYWDRYPEQRRMELAYCARMQRPEDRAAFFCPAAGYGR